VRLLGRSRQDRSINRFGTLDAYRRSCRDGRGWLLQNSWPTKGHGAPGREDHFSRWNRGGFDTPPRIEAVQVIGVPDVIHDEELCAWVKPKASFCATAEEIQAFCHGQIASHKIPRYIRFVHGFPMTMTGKVKKFVMREEMMKELRFSDNTAP
jgi:acyl-CoA synthetase (AMP-forming)/AMP-acid ligase II